MDHHLLSEHSPLGGSSAERFMACPGSPALVQRYRSRIPTTEPEYTRHGIAAHKLAAHCLGNYLDCWEAQAVPIAFDCELPNDEIAAVQSFINHVRGRIAWYKENFEQVTILLELPFHRPEIHELFYGQLDVVLLAGDRGEVIDYKHGAGIMVDVERNPQLMYYGAAMALDHPEIRHWVLTIGQPRGWLDPKMRSWDIDTEDLLKWLDTTLIPAMDAADPRWRPADVEDIHPGEHCRFCPAKRICPALRQQLAAIEGVAHWKLPDDELGELYAKVPGVRMLLKAIEDEVRRRNLADPEHVVPGTKIVETRANRVWKPEAKQVFLARFGDAAMEIPELKSPAQMEKLGGAKALVTEWAFVPEANYTVAPIDDRRKAVSLTNPAQIYQRYLDAEVVQP